MPLERIASTVSKGLFHSAIEQLDILESDRKNNGNPIDNAEILNEKGKLFFLLSDYHQAIKCFSHATNLAPQQDAWVKYQVNLAAAYRQLSELDTAHRYLGQLQQYAGSVSPRTRGHFLLNMSAVQGISGLHKQAIQNIQSSIHNFSDANLHLYDMELYHNLGLSYREMGEYEKSEECLKRSLELNATMHAFAELGRLYLKIGKLDQSIYYSQQALSKVWGSFIDFEKEELASLCHLLAQLSIRLNESDLAQRLAEKAQVYYGQLQMWGPWQEIDSEMADWVSPQPPYYDRPVEPSFFETIRHFVSWLDAVNAQELIHPSISRLLDTRVHYVKVLTNALDLPSSQTEDLIVASRFADYGLTALETEVILSPNRTEQAYEQYKMHPILSVRMMETLKVPPSISDIVVDHHECFDGTGYPHGKVGEHIHKLARVFAIADTYSTGVALNGNSHSQVLSDMMLQDSKLYDPAILDIFTGLF